MQKIAGYLLFTAFIIIFQSCSGAPPEIQGVNWQKIYRVEGNTAVFDKLSLFVNVYDEDGEGDIESLYLISDTDEIFWKLTEQEWNRKSIDTRLWIGSNGLKAADGMPPPEGKYRIIAVDKGGDRNTKEIYIPACTNRKSLPSLAVSSTEVAVTSSYRENYLYLKNTEGAILKIITITPGTTAMDLVTKDIKGSLTSITLYSFDSTESCGYQLTVPVP